MYGYMAGNLSAAEHNQDAIDDLSQRCVSVKLHDLPFGSPWLITHSCTQLVLLLQLGQLRSSVFLLLESTMIIVVPSSAVDLTIATAFVGLRRQPMHKLHNVAAHFMTRTTKYERMTCVLHGLHWLTAGAQPRFQSWGSDSLV